MSETPSIVNTQIDPENPAHNIAATSLSPDPSTTGASSASGSSGTAAPSAAGGAGTGGGPTVVVNDKVPDDKVNLRFLLVSGKKTDMMFGGGDSIEVVRKRIFESWPREWSEEAPESPAALRVLYRGGFLEVSSTLEGNKIPLGQTTVVHLLIKNGGGGEA
ncbi:hypothetical protein HK102_006763, partial [Quaeritorhiza haematococci]